MRTVRVFMIIAGLILSAAQRLHAQKSFVKTVADVRTRLPIDYVFIKSDDDNIKLMTNKDGKFILVKNFSAKEFSFYKMGYHCQLLSAQALLETDTIFLYEQVHELDEVVVRNNKIDTIVKDKRYYLDDYQVLANGNFLIITSNINVPGFNVCYYDRFKKIRRSHSFKTEKGGHFITDCFKNIHLVTNDFSRQIYFDSDSSFEFLPKYSRDVFENTLACCMLKIDTELIMKRILPPEIIHLPDYDVEKSPSLLNYYRAGKSGQQPFYTVYYNAGMREMINNEMMDWGLVGHALDEKTCNNISLFYRKIAAPLYAPLFLKNDTVIVFNFQEKGIFFLNKTGHILKKVAMDGEQFSTIHDFEILHDAVAQTFYIKLKESNRSFIKRINIYSGTVSKSIHLEKAFARNIQIVNNHIYYMVREHEWDDTQYLYQ